jgi:hypothetical protein
MGIQNSHENGQPRTLKVSINQGSENPFCFQNIKPKTG